MLAFDMNALCLYIDLNSGSKFLGRKLLWRIYFGIAGQPSFPGGGTVFTFFGTLMGACMGYGIGVARLSGRNYVLFQ
jgi:hypothetical protein